MATSASMSTFNYDPSVQPPPLLYPPARPRRRNEWRTVVLIIAICVIAGGAILASVFSMLGHSDAMGMAMAIAKSSEAAQIALGTPIEKGLFVSGSINVSGPSGRAELSVPVHGPKAKGKLYVFGLKREGAWKIQRLSLRVEGHSELIVLVESDSTGGAQPAD